MEDESDQQSGKTAAPNRQLAYAVSCALVSFTASLVVFHPAFDFSWIGLDDSTYVLDNENLRLGLTPEGLGWAFTTGHGANWFPLTWLSWMLDYEFFGMEPGPLHRTNVLLHALAAAVLSFALWRLTDSVWRSALVALVFALHPLHVESVAWITERKGVLSGLFWMLTLLAYAEYARRPFHVARYILVVTSMALGLMVKPVLVTLPFVLLLLDFWPLGRLRSPDGANSIDASLLRARATEKLPLFGLSAISSYVTWRVQSAGGAVASVQALAPVDRLKGALLAYWGYIEKTFWPHDMGILYPIGEVSLAGALLAGSFLVALTGLAWFQRRRRPYFLVGWLWFIGTLVPTIGLIQVGAQAMADRYTYLPMTGLVIALTWGIGDALPRTRVARILAGAFAVAVLAALGWATAIQLAYWKDSPTLMRHTLAVTGDNPRIERILAEDLLNRGELKEAEQLLEHAALLAPGEAQTHVVLGQLYLAAERPGKAGRSLRRALELDPNEWYAHQLLAGIHMRKHRYAEACGHFDLAMRALRLETFPLQSGLGVCLVEAGRLDEALPRLEFAAEYARVRELPMDRLRPYLNLVAAARAGTPDRLRGSDLRTPGLLRAKAELLVRANRPQAAIRELETAQQMAEILDYPEPLREALRERIEELDRESMLFEPGGDLTP